VASRFRRLTRDRPWEILIHGWGTSQNDEALRLEIAEIQRLILAYLQTPMPICDPTVGFCPP
jgi:hypothetical protein